MVIRKGMTTTDTVIGIRGEHPEFTLKQIAGEVGRTRERVRQILKKAGLPTRNSAYGKRRKKCKGCDRSIDITRTFCSWECRRTYAKGHPEAKKLSAVVFECSNCGKKFERGIYKARYRAKHGERTFCSRGCVGKFIGNNLGGGAVKRLTEENADMKKRLALFDSTFSVRTLEE